MGRTWPVAILLMLASCTHSESPVDKADKAWGGSMHAPGLFSAAPKATKLQLPSSEAELNQYILITGGQSYRTGPREAMKPPLPMPNSPCAISQHAVVFSYPIQLEAFMPRYTAYIRNGSVECVERVFSYRSM